MRLERVRKLKKSSIFNGNQTHDLAACSIVSQLTFILGFCILLLVLYQGYQDNLGLN
jgi:hypothetical protein